MTDIGVPLSRSTGIIFVLKQELIIKIPRSEAAVEGGVERRILFLKEIQLEAPYECLYFILTLQHMQQSHLLSYTCRM